MSQEDAALTEVVNGGWYVRISIGYSFGVKGLRIKCFYGLEIILISRFIKAMKDYGLPPLCFRMNSSRSMGMARSQSFSQDMDLNWDLVRCLDHGYFFIQKVLIYASRIYGLSFYAPLRSTCKILSHQRIRWFGGADYLKVVNLFC